MWGSLRPPPKLTVSEWADRNLRLSPKYAKLPGPWRTSRYPYQRGMLDAANEEDVERIVFMTGAGVGKTSILDALLGYFCDQDPAPILAVLPTIVEAEGYSKERLAPMITETPVLRRKFAENRSRDSSNTLLHKMFPGGYLALAGANSAASLQRRHVRVVLTDEVDSFPADADGEGDPVDLAVQRAARFEFNRLIILAGTPTIKGASRLERAFAESDQRRFWVFCPKCEKLQTLRWPQIRWEKDDPGSAHYACEACSYPWNDSERLTAIRDAEAAGGGWKAGAPFIGTAGFHVWEAYATSRLSSLVAEWLEKKKSRESLKTFINKKLGELWEADEGESLPWESLRERAEPYEPLTIPDPLILLVTAGVDVQDDRLALIILGWAPREECWILDWEELFGDTVSDAVWQVLDGRLARPFAHPGGTEMTIACAAIDSGHRTQRVYNHVRSRARLIAVKGINQPARPVLGHPTKQDVSWSGRTIQGGVQLWPVGSDTAKGELYARLRLEEPGPRFVHFHDGLSADFFEQLTAERLVTKFQKGIPRLEWHLPPGRRNEALDCWVYAYAAALRMGVQRMRDTNDDAVTPSRPPVAEPARRRENWLGSRRGPWLGGRR